VGSALVDESGALAYVALGRADAVRDEPAIARLDAPTRCNSAVAPNGTGEKISSADAIDGGKYLVLRNPHNRNREWYLHANDKPRRRHSTASPRSARRTAPTGPRRS